MCRDANVCALRRKFAYLFSQFSDYSSVEQPYFKSRQQVAQCPGEFMIYSCNTTANFFLLCLSLLADLLLTGEDQSQADQPTSLAEGPPM